MVRRIGQLTSVEVAKKQKQGRYADGGGLYLQVGPSGNKSWLFRYTLHAKAREMGLGPVHAVSLKEAREKAAEQRRLLVNRIDPLASRQADHAAKRLSVASTKTFKECSAAYIKAHRAGWKSAKHADQWENTLDQYCGPVFGSAPVQSIDTTLVMRALDPIWKEKNETASRLRGRIEKILDWARVRGYRSGDNPARWRGHLDKLLPTPRKVKKVRHHPALPYGEIGAFMKELRQQEGTAARALELLILTATRTNEVIGAKWSEIDRAAKTWTIPAERMKAQREHRVPLSEAAIRVLSKLPSEGDFVFVGAKPGKPLSNMAMLKLLSRMERSDLTVHGFRSTFRDWAAETTNYPREAAEAALAHSISDKTEAAYRRGDLFEKRGKLMQAWADHCYRTASAKVTPIKKSA